MPESKSFNKEFKVEKQITLSKSNIYKYNVVTNTKVVKKLNKRLGVEGPDKTSKPSKSLKGNIGTACQIEAPGNWAYNLVIINKKLFGITHIPKSNYIEILN